MDLTPDPSDVILPPLPEPDATLTFKLTSDIAIREYARTAVLAERERAALCCDDLAYFMEHGGGVDREPGDRLRQAARNIRGGKTPLRLDHPAAPCTEASSGAEAVPCMTDPKQTCQRPDLCALDGCPIIAFRASIKKGET